MNSRRRAIPFQVGAVLAICAMYSGWAATPSVQSIEDLERLLDARTEGWRFHLGEAKGAEAPDYDDSAWDRVEIGHRWWPDDSTCWYRARIVIPQFINGIDVAGTPVRLKLGVDNGAKAYVDGVFRQEFEWADGDILLTESAAPGQAFTVALHCVNRPGFGSLYQADLMADAYAKAISALRRLFDACVIALDGDGYVPADEIGAWRETVDAALAKLDFEAYCGGREDAFLQSVAKAYAALTPDAAAFDQRLRDTSVELPRLQELIAKGRKRGLDLSYARSDARVIESFLQYVRDDMADREWNHAIRAAKAAAYLDRLCAEAIHETQDILDGARRDCPVPRYRTGKVAIHDGAFWQKNRPVFFTGVGHFSQVRKDIPILNDYGLNIIQIEMGPSSALPDANTVDQAAIRRNVVEVLDNAAKHHVAVNLLVSPHYFPQWALERFPYLRHCGEGFFRFCVDQPESRAVIEKWLRALMPMIAKHPALHSICLSNEPQYVCRCDYSQKQFRIWLQKRFRNINRLNSEYGAQYADFYEIQRPLDRANYPLFFDWCRFNQDVLRRFHEFERDIIHEYDPDLPVHAKTQSLAFSDRGMFEKGLDFEAMTRLGGINGNDAVQSYAPFDPGEYPQDWLAMAINYTLQRSVAPESPIFNSEDHVIQDRSTHFIPGAHIRNCYWTQALYGQGAATTWVWERLQGGDFAGNILTRAECVSAIGRIGLDLQRIAPEVYALQRAKAEAAIFYSYSSLPLNAAHIDEAKAAFEGATFTGMPWDFVTESQALAGKLGDYKLVVVPRAEHVPQLVTRAFQKYLDSGGVLMNVGECFSEDEYGHELRRTLRPLEAGRLLRYPDPLTPHAYRDILDALLDAAGVERLMRLTGAYREPVWGVHLRVVKQDVRLLVSLANLTRQNQRVCLISTTPIKEAVNLFTNERIVFPLTLPPLEPFLLAMEP